MTHLELFLHVTQCMDWNSFSADNYQAVLTLFVEKTVLSSLTLHLCQNQLTKSVWIYF